MGVKWEKFILIAYALESHAYWFQKPLTKELVRVSMPKYMRKLNNYFPHVTKRLEHMSKSIIVNASSFGPTNIHMPCVLYSSWSFYKLRCCKWWWHLMQFGHDESHCLKLSLAMVDFRILPYYGLWPFYWIFWAYRVYLYFREQTTSTYVNLVIQLD